MMWSNRVPGAVAILLVENSAIRQRFVGGMLATLGFCVDVVVDGAEAVKAVARTEYRAILMDCQSPCLNGYAATTEIRRRQGESPHTPIVGLTASATGSDLKKCSASGMDDSLTNAFNLETLNAVLSRWTSTDQHLIPRPVIPTPDRRRTANV